jgi:tetratricopeptide (TPR) repeat protein
MIEAALHDAYQRTFLDAITLSGDGRYDEGLALLEEFYRVHQGQDSEGWLRNSVFSQQALILRDKGDYAGAVEAYRRAKWPPDDPFPYLVNAHGLALTLAAVGRTTEALAVIETSLSEARSGALEDYVPLLRFYLDTTGEQALPLHYRDLVERMAAHWKLPATPDSLSDPAVLAAIICEIDARMKEAARIERERYLNRSRT